MTFEFDFRQTLLLYYDANVISDGNFIIFYELLSSRNPDFTCNAYNRFELDEMNDDECNAEFSGALIEIVSTREERFFGISQRLE